MKDLRNPIRRVAALFAVTLFAACGAATDQQAVEPADGAVPAAQEPLRTAPPTLERVAPPDRPSPRRDRDELLPPLFDERRAPEVRANDRPPQMRVA
jgi:hypothetical protein